MPSTTNFGWTTPADTDLVKDGAAAIRTLGNGVDSSFVDLKGGTSGQILAKNSATDLDFVWIENDQGDITGVTAGTGISGGGTSGAVTITNSMATEITAKGDLIVGTGNAAFDNLPAGTNGHVLTADSTVSPTGLKWAAPASGSTFAGCSLYTTASAGIANNTYTIVNFQAENFDTDAYHSTTTNTSRITIPAGKAGKYLFVMTMVFDSNATGQRLNMIKKNGSDTAILNQGQGFASNYYFETSCIIADAAVSDYFEMVVYQNSGSTLNLINKQGAVDYTVFACTYLGA